MNSLNLTSPTSSNEIACSMHVNLVLIYKRESKIYHLVISDMTVNFSDSTRFHVRRIILSYYSRNAKIFGKCKLYKKNVIIYIYVNKNSHYIFKENYIIKIYFLLFWFVDINYKWKVIWFIIKLIKIIPR